jgi:hypothetical protein
MFGFAQTLKGMKRAEVCQFRNTGRLSDLGQLFPSHHESPC